MKIVRGNTLPDYSLLSMKAGSAEIDGYQHHEKWQYKVRILHNYQRKNIGLQFKEFLSLN